MIQKIENFVHEKLNKDSSGHDYWHILRVVNNAKIIMENENKRLDKQLVLISAWLHDIGDYKLNNGIDKSKELIYPFLVSLNIQEEYINKIIQIISEVSFMGGHNSKPASIEAMIVQDADRLDAIGAVGIARAFAFGGKKNRLIYNPYENPINYLNAEEYKKNESSTLMHFYEKLLKLKDLMNTETAKKIAIQRHNFMLEFINQFYLEVKN